jgi:dTDP-4-dehydrorhamnose reductase
MVSVLVTGSNGQLGSSIRECVPGLNEFSFTFVDINDLDLTHENEVTHYLTDHHFDYIVNCAAYTAVDKAENEPSPVYAVNTAVPALLGKICLEKNVRLIHISTDYVYNGRQSVPHNEDEETIAESVYARSKLDAEKALANNPHVLIIRTSWLYSEFGNNFLKTMMRLSKAKKELGVVFDQTGTPTYAGDLAAAVVHIIRYSATQGFKPGIYNYSNEGVCSWFDFAVEIMKLTGSECRILPITTGEYPQAATRPEYSVMNKNKIKHTFALSIPYWKDSLLTAVGKLIRTN